MLNRICFFFFSLFFFSILFQVGWVWCQLCGRVFLEFFFGNVRDILISENMFPPVGCLLFVKRLDSKLREDGRNLHTPSW